ELHGFVHRPVGPLLAERLLQGQNDALQARLVSQKLPPFGVIGKVIAHETPPSDLTDCPSHGSQRITQEVWPGKPGIFVRCRTGAPPADNSQKTSPPRRDFASTPASGDWPGLCVSLGSQGRRGFRKGGVLDKWMRKAKKWG